MQSSSESFWSEIKTYEERLKKDPASYCFAPLVEVYLKAGLLDDALAAARTGVLRYPGYVAGQMALARACHQKGLVDECRRALEVVTGAVPEHAEAQRLLARLYAESGRVQEATQVLQTLLEFSPDDSNARLELESLQRRLSAAPFDDELELIEFTEADIVDDHDTPDQLVERVKPAVRVVEDPWAGIAAPPVETVQAPPDLESVWSVPEQQLAMAGEQPQDPLITPTLAELYVSQGFIEKAIDIYRKIVAGDPENQAAADRLLELEQQTTTEAGQAAVAAAESLSTPLAVPAQGAADHTSVAILEGWLENIRRLRTCH